MEKGVGYFLGVNDVCDKIISRIHLMQGNLNSYIYLMLCKGRFYWRYTCFS